MNEFEKENFYTDPLNDERESYGTDNEGSEYEYGEIVKNLPDTTMLSAEMDANTMLEEDSNTVLEEEANTEIDLEMCEEVSADIETEAEMSGVMPEENCEHKAFTVKINHKKDIRKYVAIVVAAAIVNITALCGFFAMGVAVGRGRKTADNRQSVISSLQNPEDSDEHAVATTAVAEGELTTVEISKKVGPAVVGIISTVQGRLSIFGEPTTTAGSGSGIIISDDGYIVTNEHVISGASAIEVALNTGATYDAKVIGADARTDLAVIKIEPEETLTVAELGDSSKIQVGERAIAIGNPLGMEFFGSTTQGIISAINRSVTVENKTMNLIQTDAAINQGNSGGALVDAYGKVIGINAVKIASSSVEGMGFAIPITEASPIIQDLIKHGYVKGRPVIGISIRDVTEHMASRQGWPVGVQVMDVQEGSGAEIGGLEQGDIITRVDGKEVKTSEELNKIKDTHKPGENLNMEVYKYETGFTERVKVKLTEERPE